jgi:hypothetical protein
MRDLTAAAAAMPGQAGTQRWRLAAMLQQQQQRQQQGMKQRNVCGQ